MLNDHSATTILNALDDYGWIVLGKEEASSHWWIAEIWILQSVWSPQGCRVYLTFLVDPEWDGKRKKAEVIWAVKAPLDMPRRWQQGEGEIELILGRRWEKKLGGFLSGLTQLRDKWKGEQSGTDV